VLLVEDMQKKKLFALKELKKCRLVKKGEKEHIQIEKEILSTIEAHPFIINCN